MFPADAVTLRVLSAELGDRGPRRVTFRGPGAAVRALARARRYARERGVAVAVTGPGADWDLSVPPSAPHVRVADPLMPWGGRYYPAARPGRPEDIAGRLEEGAFSEASLRPADLAAAVRDAADWLASLYRDAGTLPPAALRRLAWGAGPDPEADPDGWAAWYAEACDALTTALPVGWYYGDAEGDPAAVGVWREAGR